MYRCIIVFLLINTISFVSPLPTSPNNGSLVSGWLAALAERCVDQFLKTQITNHTRDCDVLTSPFHEKLFECMLFYDINSRLCDAIATEKITLSEENITKINEKGTLNKFCDEAKNLTVSNITGYPEYKENTEKVFASTIKCAQFCGVDDISNEDANFYCKYFKWGLKLLTTSQKSDSENFGPVKSSGSMNTKTAILPDQKISDKTNAIAAESSSDTNVLQRAEDSNASGISKPVSSQNATAKVNHRQVSTVTPKSTTATSPPVTKKVSQQSSVSKGVQDTNSFVGLKPPGLLPDIEDKPLSGNVQSDHQNTGQLSKKVKNNDGDADYQDEGGFDPDRDIQGGDDNDDPDIKPVPNQPINLPSHPDPFTIQDGFAEQDDDHFFPFFLTTIILVVLLYVLYHNKNKVTKVLLGLIVEGRQSNRRRNSRGPAYRRLDTLEQAMSTNSSAPPSKIIY